MKTTREDRSAPGSEQRKSLLFMLHRIEELSAPGALGLGARATLVQCVPGLERVLPELARFLATESLLVAGFGHEDQNRAESRLAEVRSKARELQALLESAKQLLAEHPTAEAADAMAERLNSYLGCAVRDMIDTLENQRGELQRQS
jgi:hypothetical protein